MHDSWAPSYDPAPARAPVIRGGIPCQRITPVGHRRGGLVSGYAGVRDKDSLGVMGSSIAPRAAPEVDASVDWKGTSRYEIVRLLGQGGMGAVYEAWDRDSNQVVALKTLLHATPAALYMFKQEFRTLADVHHRNLVRLNELVMAEADRVFFTMELVRGTDFLAYVQRSGGRSGSGQPPQALGATAATDAGVAQEAIASRLRTITTRAVPARRRVHRASRRWTSCTATSSRPTCSSRRKDASCSSTSACNGVCAGRRRRAS